MTPSPSFLERLWYGTHPLAVVLLPFSALFLILTQLRRGGYRLGLLTTRPLEVPVVVVGNITVGGTGKTPVVIWLARFLRDRGVQVGIVARGYRGTARCWPQQVRPDSDPKVVGDEPVVIARRTGCPVAVGPDRRAAAEALLTHHRCEVLISDDGLQHYALPRDLEIAVIDGVRRFGNGFLIPAGPLRERPQRLRSVDLIVVNGLAGQGEHGMKMVSEGLVNVNNPGKTCDLQAFSGRRVHAVVGIGHPRRFLDQLRQSGLEVLPHVFRDHHRYSAAEVQFNDDLPVIMTEKDAVKCRGLVSDNAWFLAVKAVFEPRFQHELISKLRHCLPQLVSGDSGTALKMDSGCDDKARPREDARFTQVQ